MEHPLPQMSRELVDGESIVEGLSGLSPLVTGFKKAGEEVKQSVLKDHAYGGDTSVVLRQVRPIRIFSRFPGPSGREWEKRAPKEKQAEKFVASIDDHGIPKLKRDGEGPAKKRGPSGFEADEKAYPAERSSHEKERQTPKRPGGKKDLIVRRQPGLLEKKFSGKDPVVAVEHL